MIEPNSGISTVMVEHPGIRPTTGAPAGPHQTSVTPDAARRGTLRGDSAGQPSLARSDVWNLAARTVDSINTATGHKWEGSARPVGVLTARRHHFAGVRFVGATAVWLLGVGRACGFRCERAADQHVQLTATAGRLGKSRCRSSPQVQSLTNTRFISQRAGS